MRDCAGSGSDEISHRKGQRYLTVVVCHDSGRLVWAAAGRDRATVERFLDALGEERCREVELVSCDMAAWISGPISERCPQAELCLDPFHIVQLATDALDEIRREIWNEARRAGQTELASELKGARFALWKNPEHLTARQQAKLSDIQHTNRRLFHAYLLKEQLRQLYPAARRAGQRAARALAGLGAALTPRAVREAGAHAQRPARRGSSPPSSTASPTPASRRSTPRSA